LSVPKKITNIFGANVCRPTNIENRSKFRVLIPMKFIKPPIVFGCINFCSDRNPLGDVTQQKTPAVAAWVFWVSAGQAKSKTKF